MVLWTWSTLKLCFHLHIRHLFVWTKFYLFLLYLSSVDFFWEEVNTTFSLLNHDIKFLWLNSNYVVHLQLQKNKNKLYISYRVTLYTSEYLYIKECGVNNRRSTDLFPNPWTRNTAVPFDNRDKIIDNYVLTCCNIVSSALLFGSIHKLCLIHCDRHSLQLISARFESQKTFFGM
jgi:hypothetical protein